jgi:hypothetical protein
MKDLGEASYILGIEIHRDRKNGVLGLSQNEYLEKVLLKYNMHKSNSTPAPIVKGDSFGQFQWPKNQYGIDQIKQYHMLRLLEAYSMHKCALALT